MRRQMHGAILKVEEVTMAFGGLMALYELSFDVEEKTIKAIIGPNGAGKTTLFNIITGIFPPTAGRVRFEEREIQGLKPYRIAELGISRTFQTVELFPHMSVLENVMVGRHCRSRSSLLASGLSLPWVAKEERQMAAEAMEWLEFVGLASKAAEPAEALPVGDQKMLEISRALATEPKLICLDEPAGGLNERETQAASGLIRRIREKGITVLLVEHDMSLVMDISDTVLVLNYGRKIAEGVPEEVRVDPGVIDAYLGVELA